MKKTTGFLVFSLIALTTGVVLRSDGNVVLAFVPAICFALLQAIWRLPLRYPLLVLTFLVLTLENPSESPAAGLWRSPIYTAGALLLAHMNVTIRASWLIFSGVDVALVLLLAVSLRRWFQDPSRRLDRAGDGGPIRAFALLCLGGAVGMWLWGMARGGADVGSSLWQVQRVVYLPVFCLLFLVALRGREDREALGKVFVVAACFKAALAIYLRLTVEPPPGELVLAYATTHQDSMLFAGAFCLLVAPLLEAFDRRRARRCLLLLPLLAAGMVANHRRIVWVELAAGLAVLLAVTPWTAPKRRLARAALLSSPLALVYLVVGWGSKASIFQPVQTIRSVVDSGADPSTAWRDWENYNLFFTVRQSPILGTGYGHGYIELVKLPDISEAYALYRFIPHNAILGLWAYGGFVGFTALTTMIVVGIFLAARAHARAARADDRAAALTALAAIIVYLIHCYGDMGLGTWVSVFTVAPALAVASRLAIETGAWPGRPRATTIPTATPAPWLAERPA
jgi:hypothetical protein